MARTPSSMARFLFALGLFGIAIQGVQVFAGVRVVRDLAMDESKSVFSVLTAAGIVFLQIAVGIWILYLLMALASKAASPRRVK